MPNPKKILVVDDEADLREALSTALGNEGYQVVTANESRSALATAFQEKPDLIFLDIHMPGVDGLETLRELRADEWGATVDVFMLTAQSDIDNISKAVEYGGTNVEYLVKTDWKLSELVARVKSKFGE